MQRLKICFVAHNAYSAVTGNSLDHVGGVERQQALMANAFAADGHDVSVVVWGRDDAVSVTAAGVKIICVCRKSAGIPIARFFVPRWSSLVRALRLADADIYYYNLGDLVLGQLVAWTARNGKISVYSVSSDSVCVRDLRYLLPLKERLFYRYGLQRVDQVIVQTERQRELIKNEYRRSSSVLPMPCIDLSQSAAPRITRRFGAPRRVLWVGRLSVEKRPDWVLKIARQMPEILFDIVGQANRESPYAKRFLDDAGELSNVFVRGVVQHSDLADMYRSASVLVCTSRFEGFPNVFLESWSVGLPVVTSFDPDGVVAGADLGRVGQSVDELANAVKELLEDGDKWSQCSLKAINFFRSKHEASVALPRFSNLLAAISSGDISAAATVVSR